MEYRIEVEYNRDILKRTTNQFLKRYYGKSYIAALILILLSVSYFAFFRVTTFFAGAFIALGLLYLALFIIIPRLFHIRAEKVLNAMTIPRATFTLNDEGVSIVTEDSPGVFTGRRLLRRGKWKMPGCFFTQITSTLHCFLRILRRRLIVLLQIRFGIAVEW